MAKKTEDQKEFEGFIKKSEHRHVVLNFELNSRFAYKDRFLQMGFDCWMESKRIQREHAQG